MTGQLPYLVRGPQRRLVQSAEPRVQHAEIRRAKRVVGGLFVETEVVGVDRKHVNVTPRDALAPSGRRNGTNFRAYVEKSAAGVKSVLRRLRPEEAALLDAKDAEIAAAIEALAVLRREREEIVRAAWQRAHVVRLSEITLADDPKPAR